MTPTTTAAYDPATGQYSRIISVVDPTINLRLDPNTKSPQTNQFGIGVDRELARRMAVSISYVRKDGSDFIGWTDTGGMYRAETRTLADGRTIPVFVLTNGTAARRFLLTNPSDYFLRYNGMMARVRQALVRRLAGAGVLHAVEDRGAPAVERRLAGIRSGQFDVRQRDHLRPRSEHAHECHRHPGQRSDPRVSADGIGRDSQDGLRRGHERSVPHRTAVGGDVADLVAAGADARPARNTRLAAPLVSDAPGRAPVAHRSHSVERVASSSCSTS